MTIAHKDSLIDRTEHVRTECAHCHTPMLVTPDFTGEPFCCAGCDAVYHALHEAGLDDFYRLREHSNWEATVPRQRPDRWHDRFDDPGVLSQNAEGGPEGSLQVTLHLDGVHCAGCVWIVERAHQHLPGVFDSRLDLGRGRMTLRWDPTRILLSDITRWLERFGYVASFVDEAKTAALRRSENALLKKVGVSWAIAANVMLLAIPLYAGLGPDEAILFHGVRVISMLLATISLFYGGMVFMRRARASLFPFAGIAKLSIDVPISLGIIAGWLWGVGAAVSGMGEIWFDSITVLIAALLTARWLQLRARRRAAEHAARLLYLIPTRARLVKDSEAEPVEVDVTQLDPGDTIEVRAGDLIAADGIVARGSGWVDRSTFTGESKPESIGIGDEVFAGEAMQSGEVLHIEIKSLGQDTRLGALVDWIAKAEGSRTQTHIIDRIAGYFVLGVIFVAFISAVYWFIVAPSLAPAIVVAVLVISCPCALGMAMPLALAVGVGKAARRGVFIANENALERLEHVDTMIFDKTGTLTVGSPEIVGFWGDRDMMEIAATLEKKSAHPLSKAFENLYKDEHEVEAIEEIPGCGMRGVVDGQLVQVGRLDWLMEDHDASAFIRQDGPQLVEVWNGRGATVVGVGMEGKIVALAAIADVIRPEAKLVLDELTRRNIEVLLRSGDHPQVVAYVASELGLNPNAAIGDLRPRQKVEHVEALQEAGRVVAFVGDGINDAAASRASDVGIAVGNTTDLQRISSDIIFARDDLRAVLELLDGAAAVQRSVRRSLFGSLTYNVTTITLAALGFITPLVAAIVMPLSSLYVVGSSVAQRWNARS